MKKNTKVTTSGNTRMFFRMVYGALFRRRSRALMAVLASAVGAATLFCLAAVCIAVPAQMNQEMRAYGANLVVAPIERGDHARRDIDNAMVEHTTEMVTAKSSARHACYRYENVRINNASYLMAGIDPSQVHALNQHWNVTGHWPSPGKILVGRDLADNLGVSIGSTVEARFLREDSQEPKVAGQWQKDQIIGAANYQIAGIVDTGGAEDKIVYATLADMEHVTHLKRGTDVIEYSSSAVGPELAAIADSINEMTSMGVRAQTVTKISSADTRIITMLQTLFWMISLVVLVLTLVGVGATITSMVSQRRSEIGLRKALGASAASLASEFFVESGAYGLLGGLVGTGLGYAFAYWLCSSVFGRALIFNWWLGISSVLLSAIIAVIGSIHPVVRASRIDPAVVLREE
ncbi:ABC transporter permease [Bombiscardovia coagulans]|uniref:ABC transporter permease n=1 Tax=Bombiscardovia coagulans TaxID=686666 RepID=A0A261EU76_9BIFI|nr:FtsX-like permease family protein [Bombiscardovia coagulans]OZG50421.1 ABC transporter permease [Bombiscardovia coagulans]